MRSLIEKISRQAEEVEKRQSGILSSGSQNKGNVCLKFIGGARLKLNTNMIAVGKVVLNLYLHTTQIRLTEQQKS